MINACQSWEDFEELLQNSHTRPVLLLKHSSSCLASARAWRQFKQFAEQEIHPEYWRVLVIEQRPLSKEIARRTGVVHESPQVLLFQNGLVIWHASHGRINAKALQEGLRSRQKEFPGSGAG